MKVLLITGLLAEDMVTHYAQKSNVKTKVLALKVPVAALLTPKYIAKETEKLNLRDFDMILVPGLIRGDTSTIEDTTGIPTFKGPRYAADLPTVLEILGQVKLSKVTPACDLLKDELQRKALKEIYLVEKNRDVLLKNPGNMLIRELALGRDFPMRVMAEIIDAPLLSNDEIQAKAQRYVKLGANIIDVGMVAGESRPSDAKRAVKAIKKVVNTPVSIDTLDPDEAREAVSAGADIILSVDAGNVEDMATFASEVTVVVIPTNHNKGYFPKKAEERVSLLEENIGRARKLGITKIIGDLILDPVNMPGVVESLVAFREFAKRNPDVPLLFGTGNVTELMDADSVGTNALLAGIASEIGVSILLSTEKGNKTKGSIKELAIASKMMFLAKKRDSVPKDLGLDLLILKDKRIREEPYNRKIETETQIITAAEKRKPLLFDPKGCFKIILDRANEDIAALSFSTSKRDKPTVIIKGKSAENIYRKIVEMGLVTRLDHAAYLGSELTKAEIALKTGKEYIQDSSLFKFS
ncbi:MAG: dihydropteroate synthase-like protein [Candidatus Bathyarchaeia archaeon]